MASELMAKLGTCCYFYWNVVHDAKECLPEVRTKAQLSNLAISGGSIRRVVNALDQRLRWKLEESGEVSLSR